MQNFEYLQFDINYYSSPGRLSSPVKDEDIIVWKSLQNYLQILAEQGWTIIRETKAESGQFRTYHFKRLMAGNTD